MPRPAPRGPQPGLAVVATGAIPAGAGGTLQELERGLARPAVAPCAGVRHDLVSVSGVVPDGVDAVYLTATDGTAVRADVTDNGYTFLVAPPARRDMRSPRYVVWTAGGIPHVTPVLLPALPARACPGYARSLARQVLISPRLFDGFGVVTPPVLPRISPARAPRRP
jgi:hypothetical protein